jgi:hypothetical protein
MGDDLAKFDIECLMVAVALLRFDSLRVNNADGRIRDMSVEFPGAQEIGRRRLGFLLLTRLIGAAESLTVRIGRLGLVSLSADCTADCTAGSISCCPIIIGSEDFCWMIDRSNLLALLVNPEVLPKNETELFFSIRPACGLGLTLATLCR